MCGIGGIININNSKIDPEIAKNIKTSLEHRGPDNSSIKHISDVTNLEIGNFIPGQLNISYDMPFSFLEVINVK